MKLTEIPIIDILHDYVPELGNLSAKPGTRRISVKCPFHSGKNSESLAIYVDSNNAYCFGGCGYLDSIGIVSRQLGIPRHEARAELMEKYGITTLTPEEENELHRLELLERYVEACHANLEDEHVQALKARGLYEGTILRNKIGHHPEGFDSLNEGELLELGIYRKDSDGNIVSDFLNKIILPGYLNGRLVYVISWNYLGLENEPKYAGPGGWPKPVIGTTSENVLLVEGYFDLLSCQQAGFDTLCALGSTPAKDQLAFLRQQPGLTIMFDGDEAGRKAARELAGELYPTAKLITLPVGHDPSSFYQSLGPEKFREYLETAERKDPLKEAMEEVKNQESAVAAAQVVVKEIIPLLRRLEPIQQAAVAKELGAELKKFGITKTAIERQLKTVSGDEDSNNENETQQETLLRLAEGAVLFKNEFREPFALIEVNGHNEIWGCNPRNRNFRLWLIGLYYDLKEKGPNSESVTQAIDTLAAKAWKSDEEYRLNNRTAMLDGNFWYDLADKDWQAVKITAGGWEVVNRPPILFRRYGHQWAQPEPQRDGNIFRLFDFVNITKEKDRLLYLVSLITAFIPEIPHAAFVFYGSEGSCKSTTSKITRMIIDPSGSLTCKCYDDRREFVQYLAHNYVIILENLSSMSKVLSDTICSAITGDGDSKRELFSDDDDIIYNFKRVFIINGINNVVTQADLLRRSILFGLEQLPNEKMIEELSLREQFKAARPEIIGGVFTTLAKAKEIYPTVRLSGLYDMADFTRWGYAVAEALGLGGETFLEAYSQNRSRQVEEAISNNPVASAITVLMQDRQEWRGRSSELLEVLTEIAEQEKIDIRAKSWPKAAHSLTRQLNILKTVLGKSGIGIAASREDDKREIFIFRLDPVRDEKSVISVSSVITQENQQVSNDATENKSVIENDNSVISQKSNLMTEMENDAIKPPNDAIEKVASFPKALGDRGSDANDANDAIFPYSREKQEKKFLDDVIAVDEEDMLSQPGESTIGVVPHVPHVPDTDVEQDGTTGTTGTSYIVDSGVVPASSSDVIAVDLETGGLSPKTNDIKLVSCAGEGASGVWPDPEPIRVFLETPEIPKIFHNAVFDVHWLISKGYPVNNYQDTMLMSQVLDNNQGEHSLEALAREKLGIVLDKSLQKPENWRGMITDLHKEYCQKDAETTLQLFHVLRKELDQAGLEAVYQREIAALPAIIRLQQDGMYFDAAAWRKDLAGHVQEREELEAEIKQELRTEINLGSPKQLLECLQNRGLELKDTSDETLAMHEEKLPVLALIRQWREKNKLVTSFGEELLKLVAPDGRLYPSWRLIGATTGRMSCKNPNLQQVPHELRKYFVAPPGRMLVVADYSQIELRVAADLSGDKTMIASFRGGEDLHVKTAHAIFKRDEVTKEERQIGKTCNFGLIYGMSAPGLRARVKTLCNLNITESEAEIFRHEFFNLYRGIRNWQDKQIKAAVIKTKGGRLWEGLPKPPAAGWRNRLNYPVQGTAAEGLKEAMALMVKELPMDWKLAAVVHDEIVLDVPESQAEEAKQALVRWMVDGMKKLITTIPVEVDCKISESWQK